MSLIHSRTALIMLLLAVFTSTRSLAQVDAFFHCGQFNTPHNGPYLETYLTLVGKSLATRTENGYLHNSINIDLQIRQDTTIVKASRYNLKGPAFLPKEKVPSFIDNQRYALPNGQYKIYMSLSDNYDSLKKPLVITAPLLIEFDTLEIQASSIQALESFKKSSSENILSKSGYDLIPYPVNYYPETSQELSFYFETYNTDLILGKGQSFVYAYYLEHSTDLSRLDSYGGFKKQQSARVNPLLGRMDISKLSSGNYNLVIELRDADNEMYLKKKYFFQRLNQKADQIALKQYSEQQTIAEFVGNCNNADTLRMFVECLWPIADGLDKERLINHSLKKDQAMMKNFIVDFWQRRAADTANPLNLWADYYKNVQQVMVMFKCGKQKGYYSDRGRVYLQYGPPSQRSQQYNEHNTFPYEIWQYYRTTDGSTGQFFSNKKFVFVNKMLGDDCFMLIHSDMRGEVNNPRWQFELTRRNNAGMADPDNTIPAGSQFNQFDEIFSNPR